MGNNNKTSQPARNYDCGVRKTIPFYDNIHTQISDLVKHSGIKKDIWLDTGCGTGYMVKNFLPLFPNTQFILADPSKDMLKISKEKLVKESRNTIFICDGTETLSLPNESINIITAVLAHHYLSKDKRCLAIENCLRMLSKGGMLITCEHVAASCDDGVSISLSRWADYQRSAGKSAEKVESHIARYNVDYFPITIEEHFSLMRDCGFHTVELLWASYSDAVFYAIKDKR